MLGSHDHTSSSSNLSVGWSGRGLGSCSFTSFIVKLYSISILSGLLSMSQAENIKISKNIQKKSCAAYSLISRASYLEVEYIFISELKADDFLIFCPFVMLF